MPIFTIELKDGYDEAFCRQLSRRLASTARMLTGSPADSTAIVINQVESDSDRGKQSKRTPRQPPKLPSDIILSYLAAMEARDLEQARSFLASDFTMIFPGGERFDSLDGLLAWSKNRYRFIGKTIGGVHDVAEEDGAVVYCMGTLAGEWPDGSPFSGIRFIDRFTVRNGKLADQQVWNDLAEAYPHP